MSPSPVQAQQNSGKNCTIFRELFKTFTFVGCVDPEKCLIQFGTSIYSLNLSAVLKQFFYQMIIFNFGNFSTFKIVEPNPPISELLEVLASLSVNDENYAAFQVFQNPENIEKAENLLASNIDLFSDYFSIKFERDETDRLENSKIFLKKNLRLVLSEIPCLMTHFCPQLEKLPFLIGALVMDVDYGDEKSCFSGIAKSLGDFLTIHKCFVDNKNVSELSDARWEPQIRQIVMPQLRKKLLPSEDTKSNIEQLADAHDLYKVFERCGN